jgi:hypothetical protein
MYYFILQCNKFRIYMLHMNNHTSEVFYYTPDEAQLRFSFSQEVEN